MSRAPPGRAERSDATNCDTSNEPNPLARRRRTLIGAEVLAAGFAGLAVLVNFGETATLDRWIALLFRDPVTHTLLGPAWFQEAARDVTGLGSVSVSAIVLIIAVSQCAAAKFTRSARTLGFGVISGTAVCFLLKIPLARPRPDLVGNAPQVFTASFPSAHSMTSVLLFWLMGLLVAEMAPNGAVRRVTAVALVILTLLIGFSRIYFGVHWTSDVLAGWLGGSTWALLVWWWRAPACRTEVSTRL